VKLGAAGIEEVIQIKLTEDEQAALNRSAAAVQELKEALKKLTY
jgi:malate dehydrogenase